MSFLRSKRGLAAAGLVVILALFLIRPGADQLRVRIARSVSLALGRPVELGEVTLHLLPSPGFDLSNFVIHEDPAFGAEPVLFSDSVTARLRVPSLLRGRLEISRLKLNEPSLNLVQNTSGHWNLENLLERVDQTPVAPTSKSRSEARPGFPYIEATGGRINFKFGQEKKAYTLTDSDFAIWQDSENAWGMRLTASPVRTDFNLSNTGTIQIEGSWQRAASLRETPLRFDLQWENGQLGQATTLFYGGDQGWRGGVTVTASLRGTPGNLLVNTQATIDDFRRYDLLGGGSLRLSARCKANYSSESHAFSKLACLAPVGTGSISVEGNLSGWAASRAYDLDVTAQNLPMQSIVALARHAKKDIPDDLIATGSLDGKFNLKRQPAEQAGTLTWSGQGDTEGFGLSSKLTNTEISLDKIPFAISSAATPPRNPRHPLRKIDVAVAQTLPHLEFGPFNLALGRPSPVVVRGWMSRSEYSLGAQGEGSIEQLLQMARTAGLTAFQTSADGIAKVDLQLAGTWSAFNPARATGTAQLRNVDAAIQGWSEPLEIVTANLTLTPDEVDAKNISASLGDTAWHGSVTLPRKCTTAKACPAHFDLHADEISTDAWGAMLNANPGKQPWYRLLSSNSRPGNAFLLGLRASGSITVDHLMLHKLPASHVSANATLDGGTLKLSELRGDVLGGKHKGECKIDFTARPPAYSGTGALQQVSLALLADAMHDDWITGTGSGNYKMTSSGTTAADLISSADASLQVDAFDGRLPHITLSSGTEPLQMQNFSGRLLLHSSKIEVDQGKLTTPEGIYEVSGTASLNRVLDIKLLRQGATGFNITGSILEPHVIELTASDKQAALKP